MKPISNTRSPLVLRTDFSDDAVWDRIRLIIYEQIGDFGSPVNLVNDPQYGGISIPQVLSLIPAGSEPPYIYIVDGTTISNPAHPVLVLDPIGRPGLTKPGRSFRVILNRMNEIEANLSIDNMDVEDFIGSDIDYEA